MDHPNVRQEAKEKKGPSQWEGVGTAVDIVEFRPGGGEVVRLCLPRESIAGSGPDKIIKIINRNSVDFIIYLLFIILFSDLFIYLLMSSKGHVFVMMTLNDCSTRGPRVASQVHRNRGVARCSGAGSVRHLFPSH